MLQQPPHPAWLPFLHETYSFLRFVIIAALGAVIAIGDVTKEHSYGLEALMAILFALATMNRKGAQ